MTVCQIVCLLSIALILLFNSHIWLFSFSSCVVPLFLSVSLFSLRLMFRLLFWGFVVGRAVWRLIRLVVSCVPDVGVTLPKVDACKSSGRRLRLGVGLYPLSFQKISKISSFLTICKSIICGLFVFLTLL